MGLCPNRLRSRKKAPLRRGFFCLALNFSESLDQFATDDFDRIADEAYDVCRVDFDIAAIDHHIYGMLERFPDVVGIVDVFFAELCCRAKNRLVEVLEKFFEKRMRRNADADFRALDIELACDVRVCRENERIRAGNALLDDAECKVAHVGVTGGKTNIGNNQRHDELFHGLLERIKLVDRLGRFGIASDGVTGFSGVEDEAIVFENFCRLLYDSRLRVFWMYFNSHNFLTVFRFWTNNI